MLQKLLGLRSTIIAVLVALTIGFGVGWRVSSEFSEARALKLEVAGLHRQIEARDAAAKADIGKAQVDAAKIAQLEEAIREAESKTPAAVCLDRNDTRRLRNLWK